MARATARIRDSKIVLAQETLLQIKRDGGRVAHAKEVNPMAEGTHQNLEHGLTELSSVADVQRHITPTPARTIRTKPVGDQN